MVKKLAKLLKLDSTQLGILAGYLPSDVEKILYGNPVAAPAILREAFGEYVRSQELSVSKNEQQKSGLSKTSSLYKLEQADCFQWLDSGKATAFTPL